MCDFDWDYYLEKERDEFDRKQEDKALIKMRADANTIHECVCSEEVEDDG